MCKNATATAAALMAAIEPTIVNLLTSAGIMNTPDAQAAKAAFDAALQAVENWKSGTPADDVLQAINAFSAVFNTLPIPPNFKTLANIIVAGITAVIGVINANAPAPAHATAQGLTSDDAQAHHQANVVADTAEQVQALVPGFKRSVFTPPDKQYKNTWNNAVKSGNFPAELQVS